MFHTIITGEELLSKLNLFFRTWIRFSFTGFIINYIISKLYGIVIVARHPKESVVYNLHLDKMQIFVPF